MAIPPGCNPSALANAANCFESCIPEPQSVKSFLLCQSISNNKFSACCTPNQPFNFHVTSQTSTSVSLAWIFLGPCGPDRFTVFWGTTSGVYTNSFTQVGGFLNAFTVTGLTTNTTYFFNVKVAQKGCTSPFAGEISAMPCTSAVVNTWAARVITNGGAAVSVATQQAICNYWNGLVADGLDTTMIYVLILLNDNLVASLTPLVNTPLANNPATNNGPFVAGDLGVNGLTGNATTKFLDEGIQFSSAFPSGQNAGWSVYDYNSTATGFTHGDYEQGTGKAFMGACHHSDGKSYSYIGATATNVISLASPGNGMYSGNRVSSTDHRLYFANSTNAPAQIGATDATAFAGALPGVTNVALVFATFNQGGVGNQFLCSDTLSYQAYHSGHSLAQFTKHFNRVQTMLQTLGGGFR